MDAVRFAAPRAYVQFSYFNRGAVPPLNLKYYALRVEPAGTWHQLPDIELPPGGTVRIDVADIPGLASLPESGALALYPFEPNTVYPPGNYQHTCTKILDYVAWGLADAAPAQNHPAVQAGLWQAGAIVLASANAPGRVALREAGQNNRGALSWSGGTALLAPLLTPVPSTNLAPVINFAWQSASGAVSYDLDCSTSAIFTGIIGTNVSGTNSALQLAEGRWNWRVRSRAGAVVSGYRSGNAFDVIPEPLGLVWLGLLLLGWQRKRAAERP